MMRQLILLAGLACVARTEQPSAPAPVSAPLRDLPWGDINFLHTTDTHGWLAGHLSEPSYSGDWGDYVSFAEHLRKKAEDDGNDLLVIDTGDRIEGNGLYDASQPQGNYSRDIFAQQGIDIMCIGNHELYKKSSAENELLKVVPQFSGSYLASNVDVINPKDGKRVPLAQRFKKFETKKRKARVVAFGFLYNFQGGGDNSFVQPVEETIAEEWFQNAIKDREVDLFIVAGHIPAHSDEFQNLYKAIRAKQWDVPIAFFGGHRHVRDYAIYDQKAQAIASGRYLETIGFLSIAGLEIGDKKGEESRADVTATPTFGRKYIDNNLISYYHHTGLDNSTFTTERGRNTSAMIGAAREALKLDHKVGCAPDTLWVTRAEYPSDASIFSWLESKVLPEKIVDPDRKSAARIIIANTGAMRFDLFKGSITSDTMYTVSPFTNGFRYIKDVPYETADRLLTVLNNSPGFLKDISPKLDEHMLGPPEQYATSKLRIDDSWPDLPYHGSQSVLRAKPDLRPGYTTKDDAGKDGDDTEHSPFTSFKVPNCFEARVGTMAAAGTFEDAKPVDKVDLVYIEFIQPWILAALKFLASGLGEKDTLEYMHGQNFTSLITEWVQENWKGDC